MKKQHTFHSNRFPIIVFIMGSLLSFIMAGPILGQTGTMTTYAGAGGTGALGDGGPAILAHFYNINKTVFDADGNLYVSEYYGHRVRKIDVNTSIITTILGTGTPGTTGIGGLATDARTKEPFGMAFDAVGHLYIAEFGDSRILKIHATSGIISLVSSGVEGFSDSLEVGNAAFKTISDIKFGPDGNLYISDMWNNRIRMIKIVGDTIAPATDSIVTIVGNGIAGYAGDGLQANDPSVQVRGVLGLAFDSNGDLYFCGENHVVRKVDATTGVVSTYAGTGSAGYNDGAASGAQFNVPLSLLFDQNDNLFISDLYNHRLRKIDASGIVSTVAGTGVGAYSGEYVPASSSTINLPTALAMDASGDIYFGEGAPSHRIRKVEGIATPFPAVLYDFKGKLEANSIRLTWSTISEQNNASFGIEKSQDGLYFETIGQITGAGNSTQPIFYSFLDERPLVGSNYYRLRQIDLDGNFTLSPIIEVNRSSQANEVLIYPNPVSDLLSIVILNPTSEHNQITLNLKDIQGRTLLVKQEQIQSSIIQLDCGHLPSGLYLLKVFNHSTGTSSAHRIVK